MRLWYILDNNHKPVSKPVLEAAEWMEKNLERKKVAYHELKDLNGDDVNVSTVFLGLDHSWLGYGKPVLWETMIFGGEHDQYQARYTTYEHALEGHQEALNLVNNVVSS